MQSKLSVFYDHILQAKEQTGRSRRSLLREVREAGIDAVEINATMLARHYVDIRWALKRAGLDISCIYETCSLGMEQADQAEIAKAKKTVDLAAKTGSPRVLIIPGFLSQKEAAQLNQKCHSYEETAAYMNTSVTIQNMKRALTALTAYAQKKQVTIVLEDFDGETSPCARQYELKWFMEQVPGLRYAFDTGNFIFSDENAADAYELLKESVVHVHCKDRGEEPDRKRGTWLRGLRSVPVGSGYLPMQELITSLLEDGYEGYFAIEHFDAPNQAECMKESAQFLQGVIARMENTMKKIIIIICFALVILLGSCGHETAVIRKNYVCHRSTISENRQLYDISAYSTGNTMSIYYATYSDGSSTIHQQVTETGADSDTENMTHNEFTEQALFTVEGEVYQIAATADSVWVLTVLADPVAETSGGISIYGYCLGRYDLAGNLLYETEALSGLMESLDDYSIITMQPDQKGNIVLLGNGCGIYCFGEGTETAFTYSGLLVATGRTMKDEPIICLMEEDQFVIREVNASEQKCKKIGTVTESLAGVNSILQTGKNKYALLTTNGISTYNSRKKQTTELLNWLEAGIDKNLMKSAFFYEDDRVVVLTYELGQSSHRLSYNDLVPSEMASVSGKQEITLACADYLEPALEDDILAFNTSNADYEVQVKYYQQEGMTEDLVNLLEFCKKYGYEHGTGGNLLESARDRTLIMFDTGNGDAIRLTEANLTMTSFSDCKEDVWEFIKYCLSEERQSSQYEPINANKFPTIYLVNRKGFEACAQSMLSMAYDYILDENGEVTEIVEHGSYTISIEDDTFYYNVPTQEDVDEIQEAIEGMSQIFIVDDEIWKIITEEADAYFYGDADPWQVAKNIQNRVSLFVSESR